jgi:hypothetical protein
MPGISSTVRIVVLKTSSGEASKTDRSHIEAIAKAVALGRIVNMSFSVG